MLTGVHPLFTARGDFGACFVDSTSQLQRAGTATESWRENLKQHRDIQFLIQTSGRAQNVSASLLIVTTME